MTEWSASAVLAISHGAVESNLGRKRYAAFADWPEFRLHLLAPRQWHEYGRCLQADPAEAPGITLHIEDIRLARLPLIKWYGHHYPRLGAIVKEVQPDVIHLWEEPWSVVALQATALCGSAALVLEVDQNILKRLLPPFESIRRRVLRRADLILARSQDAEDVVRACGFAGPVRRIGYGVDQNIFKPGVRQRADKSGLRLAYVGRLDETKGLEDIVCGMAASKSISQLTIVGEGPYKSQLMKLVRQHGLMRRVTVIPWSDTHAVADAFRRADVSLIVSRTTASRREQFGRTIIESQACGVPVIGSSSGSIPEVVGAGGWIVPERDPKALCQLFDRLADVPEEIEDRGQAALKNVASRFTFDITARVLRDAWLEARQERTRLGEEMRPQCVSDPKSDLADPEARNPGVGSRTRIARIRITRRAFAQLGAAGLLARPAGAQAATVYSAASFVDSVGVNTHVSSEPYKSRFAQLRDLLRAAGIRHVRDELRPNNNLDHWRELNVTCRVRSHLLVSPATNTVPQMMAYLEKLGIEKVSAIEGQNEGDADWFMAHKAAKGNWSKTVVDYQREVFGTLRQVYTAEALPIVSPSVIDWKPKDVSLLRPAADYCDVVAIHSYAQHAEPPETDADYASLAWYLKNMRDPFKPGAPVMCTETGYNNLVKPGGSGISERASAAYLPRLLLHNFTSGVRRTFLYEFFDGGNNPSEWEHHFGLVRNDGTPKPAYFAVAGLIAGLTKVAAPTGRPPRELGRVTVSAGSAHLRVVTFAAADEGRCLAVWRAVPCWDRQRGADVSVDAEPVNITAEAGIAGAEVIRLGGEGPRWSPIASTGNVVTIQADANVTLLRLPAK